MRLVLYTTRYRGGGASFERAAQTMCDGFRADGVEVRLARVESKADVRRVLAEVAAADRALDQFHLVTHGGMYGPMFGSTAWPEQFSPHEWRALSIPFAEGAEAFFHTCRSARWFAPFFAQTFGVPAHGYHWYTAFSRAPNRFVWPGPGSEGRSLYVFGCPGKKSHGWPGSIRKYTGRTAAEPMRRFEPCTANGHGSYDPVASAYDAVFDDIAVRHDEVKWLESRIGTGPLGRVLDLGCGNGALLARLAPRLDHAVGVDTSQEMIAHARVRLSHAMAPHRGSFDVHRIEGPTLPVADHSLDLAISMLSFRYLDWDPILKELRRALRPDGRFLIVDMVDKPAPLRAWPRVVADRLRARRHGGPGFRSRLSEMVGSASWRAMLQHNPMRALHEYEWFLGSRFPKGSFHTLNVGRRARVIAFDSGPMSDARLAPLEYP